MSMEHDDLEDLFSTLETVFLTPAMPILHLPPILFGWFMDLSPDNQQSYVWMVQMGWAPHPN